MDPSNFVVRSNRCFHTLEGSNPVQNATWIINNLKVFKKQLLNGQIEGNGSSASLSASSALVSIFSLSLLFALSAGLLV